MISFPGCKINLGLDVLNRRENGYHSISSILYPVAWSDVLELVLSDELKFTSSGLTIPGKAENNLCLKAYYLLKEKYSLPPVHIHLHKIIPMGGGLGGGSSNGAETLMLLNKKFNLKISNKELKRYAAQLGSDCPFFIDNTAQLATETGTTLKPVDLNLKGYYLKLVNLGIHQSTAEAYQNLKFSAGNPSVDSIIKQPIENWKNVLQNSFEAKIFNSYPSLKTVKQKLYEEGAVFAAMTGSGSTLFGIYKTEPSLSFKSAEFEKVVKL